MKTLILAVVMAASGCALQPAEVITERPAEATPVMLGSGPVAHRLRVMRVAHASVLLDFDGTKVLTDPWFSEKTGYHHGEPLGMSLAELPKLDAVIASHDHYDHFDLETFKAYPYKDVPFFVGVEMAEKAREAGFTDVRPLKPWEHGQIGELEVMAAPGDHGVAEITYVILGKGFSVFFGGDTKKIPTLDEIPAKVGAIDLALMPVNGLRAVGTQVVMNAEEAAEVTAKLAPAVAIPIHYTFKGSGFTDTFILSYDGTPDRFVAAVKKDAPNTQVEVLAPGQWFELDKP